MKFIFFLLILGGQIFFTLSVFADSQCIDLFEREAFRYNWKASSLIRFDASVEKTPEAKADALVARWAKKVGKPLDGLQNFKNFLFLKTITHQSIHLSPDHKFVVSRGSDSVIRVYSAESKEKISELRLPESALFGIEQIEVIYVSNHHFVVGHESGQKKDSDALLGIDRFYPTTLFLVDFSGKIQSHQSLEQVLKRTEISADNRYWFTLVADQLIVEDIARKKIEFGRDIEKMTERQFVALDHFIYQTFHFSKDNKYLLIAAISHRGEEAKVLVFRNNANLLTQPELVGTYPVSAKRIYKIDLIDDSHLSVLFAKDSSDGALEEVIIDTGSLD